MPARLVTLAVVVAALLATACGSDGAQTTTAATAPAAPTPEAAAGSPAATATQGSAFPVTIEHKFGSTEIAAQPERVVSVGFTDQDYLLALGATPVGVREGFGEHPSATWPWATDELGDAEPVVLARDEVDFEQVAALDPDLIIGLYSGMTEEEYGLLAGIAPTVGPSAEFADCAIPWQEQTRITGRTLGLEDPGPADLLADPLYQGLDVVAEGRDLYLGYDLYAGALAFSSILSLPFVLDEVVPQMAAAVDGDPATEATSAP